MDTEIRDKIFEIRGNLYQRVNEVKSLEADLRKLEGKENDPVRPWKEVELIRAKASIKAMFWCDSDLLKQLKKVDTVNNVQEVISDFTNQADGTEFLYGWTTLVMLVKELTLLMDIYRGWPYHLSKDFKSLYEQEREVGEPAKDSQKYKNWISPKDQLQMRIVAIGAEIVIFIRSILPEIPKDEM